MSTPEERQADIRRQILRILNDCGHYMLPEPRLVEMVQVSVSPPPTRAECMQQVTWLEASLLVKGITPALGGPVKWCITDAGRLELSH